MGWTISGTPSGCALIREFLSCRGLPLRATTPLLGVHYRFSLIFCDSELMGMTMLGWLIDVGLYPITYIEDGCYSLGCGVRFVVRFWNAGEQ